MVNIPVKELLSLITSALTIAAFVPYVRSILKRETRPHVLSWVIWAISTTTVFAAQLASGGGVGAWPTGLSGIITFGIAILAVSAKGELDIKPVDWACLFAAGAAIALWVVNSDPLWSVIIITAVDLLGFVPTARKSYYYPRSENMTMYGLMAVRNITGTFALEQYSITTILFPAAMTIAIVLIIPMVLIRRICVKD